MPATFSSTSSSHDKLIAGELPIRSAKTTLLSGEAARLRGAVLGRTATAATVAAAVAAAGNTGNGTVTLNNPAFGGSVKEGTYRITIVEPGANVGTFIVEDPDGIIVDRGVVATLLNGAHLKLTINDGAADFISGDMFTVAVSAVTYKHLRAVAAATDGSAAPVAILAEDADATSGDVDCLIYERGDFNSNALNFGAGHTAATVREPLRKRGITLVAAQPAS